MRWLDRLRERGRPQAVEESTEDCDSTSAGWELRSAATASGSSRASITW
jgi:hypothetical protein